MARWVILRTHISAHDLGTMDPWIPSPVIIEAEYYQFNGFQEQFIEFKDQQSKVVYMIRSDSVRSIQREDFEKIHYCGKQEEKGE